MIDPPAGRSVLHLDADAFFASVEQRDDARLRGRPVAVGTGVVASCSYEARRWGVRTGMALGEARRLCRPLLVLPGDYRRYEQAARRILAICRDRAPVVEVAALDDLYLDLTGAPHPERLPDELRAQVRDEVGLGVSIGVGANKLVAAVATERAKPGGNVAVPPGTERAFLEPWPARILPGVGPKVAARLDRVNVRTVAELAGVPPAVLYGLFGRRGKVLRDQAHGIDPRPVEPYRPPQSVSRRTSFDPPAADPAFLGAMLDHLTERAAAWLRFNDRAARGVVVTLRYGDYEFAEGRTTLRRPADGERELKEAARDRFARLYARRLPLRLLGVALAPVVAPDAQASLFPDPAAERRRRLDECKDAVRQRFGFLALTSGASLVLSEKLERDRENYKLRTPCLTR
ncbi:MAG TPA: DNA polymerase IV [Gemmataceae bacterium]|nr:DNA polymerase IV [Gemmataceae bacterium]